MFNKEDVLDGVALHTDKSIRYDNPTGNQKPAYLDSTTMFTTHKIAVKYGDVVRNNIGWLRVYFFKADGEKILEPCATGNSSVTEITTPENASYVRLSSLNRTKDTLMVTINEPMPVTYEPYFENHVERTYNSWDSTFTAKYYKDDDGNGTANTVHPLDEAHKRFIAPKVEAFIKQIYHIYIN